MKEFFKDTKELIIDFWDGLEKSGRYITCGCVGFFFGLILG